MPERSLVKTKVRIRLSFPLDSHFEAKLLSAFVKAEFE